MRTGATERAATARLRSGAAGARTTRAFIEADSAAMAKERGDGLPVLVVRRTEVDHPPALHAHRGRQSSQSRVRLQRGRNFNAWL